MMCVAWGSKWKLASAEYFPITFPTPVYCPPSKETFPISLIFGSYWKAMAKFVSGPNVVMESCYLYFNALYAMNLAADCYWIKFRSYSLMVSPRTCFLSLSMKSKLLDWLYVFGNGSRFMMGFLAPTNKIKRTFVNGDVSMTQFHCQQGISYSILDSSLTAYTCNPNNLLLMDLS